MIMSLLYEIPGVSHKGDKETLSTKQARGNEQTHRQDTSKQIQKLRVGEQKSQTHITSVWI